ncbi:uncharacterized protein SPPG_05290 [Spizellomyces punctatus DAOM BR117]|uniref:Uncharacterized protein n=1 Tax=Spizellomyces punctatus (strain DAOM BR117) TaxID=645134 RepID=A0A0L0HGF8_SPIPD|nr:uncharacterized protein SPPG_05290 [Spizellomyces punctatus DAOM BR117]KNC99918.1 hypothetical protein SPPG_05290 [Spizellomyces punctatus DAOM BR117]|eukprot:XP_016607958.1 hypothetical protein SPPG_05290 [Spizellomyces punctatus DAOM BR117]
MQRNPYRSAASSSSIDELEEYEETSLYPVDKTPAEAPLIKVTTNPERVRKSKESESTSSASPQTAKAPAVTSANHLEEVQEAISKTQAMLKSETAAILAQVLRLQAQQAISTCKNQEPTIEDERTRGKSNDNRRLVSTSNIVDQPNEPWLDARTAFEQLQNIIGQEATTVQTRLAQMQISHLEANAARNESVVRELQRRVDATRTEVKCLKRKLEGLNEEVHDTKRRKLDRIRKTTNVLLHIPVYATFFYTMYRALGGDMDVDAIRAHVSSYL